MPIVHWVYGVGLVLFLFLSAPARAEQGSIAIQLNKLEVQSNQCSAYFVIDNTTKKNYSDFTLDMVLFRSDGVIDQRFAVKLGPLTANKRVVKLFNLDNTPCDRVGSFLINDVVDCKSDAGSETHCLDDITVSSLAAAKLAK